VQCPRDSVGAELLVQSAAMARLVSTSISQGIDLLRTALRASTYKDFNIAPQHSHESVVARCGDLALESHTLAEFYKACWGLPEILFQSVAISSKEIARPIPTDFKFSNLKIRDFDLGAAPSVCDGTRCRIRIPIQKLSIVFDLAASALLNAKPLTKLKI